MSDKPIEDTGSLGASQYLLREAFSGLSEAHLLRLRVFVELRMRGSGSRRGDAAADKTFRETLKRTSEGEDSWDPTAQDLASHLACVARRIMDRNNPMGRVQHPDSGRGPSLGHVEEGLSRILAHRLNPEDVSKVLLFMAESPTMDGHSSFIKELSAAIAKLLQTETPTTGLKIG